MSDAMRVLSVCSGIEAASVAWQPLGWEPVAFSEIEAFPCAVLAHHYPNVPNFGDMTKLEEWPDANPDVLVGGTPCQSFSVAGLRQGFRDPRGNLALTYLAVADRYRPDWLVWENVPGVLSSNSGRDFGAFVGGLAELGYGWAYRVLDAQFIRTRRFPHAVPQRRRRVFVVGYLGDWRRAAAVLFEPESLSGNSPPRREAGQGSAGGAPQGFGGGNTSGPISASACLTAKGQRIDFEVETFVTHALAIQERAISENPSAGPDGAGVRQDGASYTLEARAVPQAVAFDCKGSQVQHSASGASPTLRAMGHANSHPNAGGQLAVATSWAVRRLTPRECERLMGFPDDYTLIPYRRGMAADGPRYKALGNSMAVNVMEWIGERIAFVEGILEKNA